MLSLTIFLPLLTGLGVLFVPRAQAHLTRRLALGGSLLTLGASLVLWAGYDPAAGTLQWRTTLAWIPSIGASFDVGVDGLSLPLVVLTAKANVDSKPGWATAQEQLAALSSNSRHTVADMDHVGFLHDPIGAAQSVTAITDVVTATRNHGSVNAR